MSKHTPGPWRVDADDNTLITTPDLYPVGETVAKAALYSDARLIAAAPELLEALVALLDVSEELCGLGLKEMIKAHEVIKKATGENK